MSQVFEGVFIMGPDRGPAVHIRAALDQQIVRRVDRPVKRIAFALSTRKLCRISTYLWTILSKTTQELSCRTKLTCRY